jgi:hypothetical protein
MTVQLTTEQQKYGLGLAQQLPAIQRARFMRAVESRLDERPAHQTVWRVIGLIWRELERGELLARRQA